MYNTYVCIQCLRSSLTQTRGANFWHHYNEIIRAMLNKSMAKGSLFQIGCTSLSNILSNSWGLESYNRHINIIAKSLMTENIKDDFFLPLYPKLTIFVIFNCANICDTLLLSRLWFFQIHILTFSTTI